MFKAKLVCLLLIVGVMLSTTAYAQKSIKKQISKQQVSKKKKKEKSAEALKVPSKRITSSAKSGHPTTTEREVPTKTRKQRSKTKKPRPSKKHRSTPKPAQAQKHPTTKEVDIPTGHTLPTDKPTNGKPKPKPNNNKPQD